MKRIFVCSKYSGDTQHNVETAQKICKEVIKQGHAPFAPHLFYPQMLDDNKKEDREAGLLCGKFYLDVCDEMWVYADEGISSGMESEIRYAIESNKTIVYIKGMLNE